MSIDTFIKGGGCLGKDARWSRDCPVGKHEEIKLFDNVLGLLASFCYSALGILGYSGRSLDRQRKKQISRSPSALS